MTRKKWGKNRKKENRADYYGYTMEEVRAFRRLDELHASSWTPDWSAPVYEDAPSRRPDGRLEDPVPKNPRGYLDMAHRGYEKVERHNRFECWEHKDLGVTVYLDSTDYRKFIAHVWLRGGLVSATMRFAGRPVKDFIVEIERLAREGKLVCSTCGAVMDTAAYSEMAWRFCEECWEGGR